MYDEAFNFSDGIALVNIGDVCWYIDKTGNKLIKAGPAIILRPMTNRQGKPELRKLSNPYNPFINGYAVVTRNSTWKIIDKANKEYPLEVEFDDLILPQSIYGVIKFKKNGKVGLINNQGKLIAPAIYDDTSVFLNGVALYKSGNEYGYIDIAGQKTILPDYLGLIGIAKLDIRKNYFLKGFAEILISKIGYVYIDKAGREFREK